MGIVTGLVDFRMLIPSKCFTCNCGSVALSRLVDGQVQGHHAVATVGGGEGLHVFARHLVGFLIPSVASTSNRFNLLINRLVDGEVQGHHAVTTRCGSEGLCVFARLIVGFRIPSVAFTSGSRDCL